MNNSGIEDKFNIKLQTKTNILSQIICKFNKNI